MVLLKLLTIQVRPPGFILSPLTPASPLPHPPSPHFTSSLTLTPSPSPSPPSSSPHPLLHPLSHSLPHPSLTPPSPPASPLPRPPLTARGSQGITFTTVSLHFWVPRAPYFQRGYTEIAIRMVFRCRDCTSSVVLMKYTRIHEHCYWSPAHSPLTSH